MSEPPSSKDLDPYPATTRRIPTQHPYTLKCEEPQKVHLDVNNTVSKLFAYAWSESTERQKVHSDNSRVASGPGM